MTAASTLKVHGLRGSGDIVAIGSILSGRETLSLDAANKGASTVPPKASASAPASSNKGNSEGSRTTQVTACNTVNIESGSNTQRRQEWMWGKTTSAAKT